MNIWPREEAEFYTNPTETRISVNVLTPIQLCQQDFDRRVLMICNGQGAASVSVGINPNLITLEGFILDQGERNLIVTYAEHGPLVQQAWYVCPNGSGAFLTVISQSEPRNPDDYGYRGVYVRRQESKAGLIAIPTSGAGNPSTPKLYTSADLINALADKMPALFGKKG